MTKIDIISGFLGAGKTTLIKKLIKEAYTGEKLVLIENEFGEIGIDGGFMQDAGISVTEMNSGCICCSLVGDFGKALGQVLEQYAPDRIIIEPSGVGKLSDVIRAVQGLERNDILLNGFTTVVDAGKCRMYMKNFGEFFNNQVEFASSIILSHTDGMDDKKLAACVEMLREHNKTATIVTTPWNELDGSVILSTMEAKNTLDSELEHLKEEYEHEHHHHHDGEECGCGHHHHHHADEVFTSWGEETTKKFTKEELKTALDALGNSDEYGVILRAKGIVSAADGSWIHFDYVPGEPDIRSGSAGVIGRLCVIGSGINEDKLKALFDI